MDAKFMELGRMETLNTALWGMGMVAILIMKMMKPYFKFFIQWLIQKVAHFFIARRGKTEQE